MPPSEPSHLATCASSMISRLLLGVPLLCLLLTLFACVFWAIHGFPPELAPRHWLDDGGLPVLVMGVFGGVAVALAAGGLWMLGAIAVALGEGAIIAWRRLHRAARPADGNDDKHGTSLRPGR